MGSADSLYHADALRDRIRFLVCRGRHYRTGAGPNVTRLLFSRYVFRDRALSPGDGCRLDFRNVRGDVLLVSKDVRPDDEREPWQAALLDHLHRRLCDLCSVSRDGTPGHAAALRAIH